MKTCKNLYPKVYSLKNLILAWEKARKGKTRKSYVMEFEKDIAYNLKILSDELQNQTYQPKPLETFILRDPKTRKISKSDFRDRIVHHALVNVIEPIFDKTFIYDSCANRKGKGNLFAIRRLYKFMGKVSRNGKINGWITNNQVKGYCLKADIKHYFQKIKHEILLEIIRKKIRDEKVIWLVEKIIRERDGEDFDKNSAGMPLGNLTSQFFANVYLNELDQFVKHKLKSKFYIRYVDDFVLVHNSKNQLQVWKREIEKFLSTNLKLELHPDKSKIILFSKGIDFVGFINFYHFNLLRKRNLRNMKNKIRRFLQGEISEEKLGEIFQGWNAYAMRANSFYKRTKMIGLIIKSF
ncbi:hypothetical protein COU59_03215 [Candidatus Pacearchaeota archaeon CG10_big_fil_rev_8_21_14_0_10_34_12]|nr:MAG: hypothetical protein COU59_03215 [Candidatus Pacearchaeota archaeon CG10_big_fil_rev_8_21_14_0_10_34_12]